MNCQYSMCRGHTSNDFCSDHGALCAECGIPRHPVEGTTLCWKCRDRAAGILCDGCGSPWLYMRAHPDLRPLCKGCVFAIIREGGYEQWAEEVLAKMRAAVETNEQREARENEERERREATAEQVRKGQARRTKKDDGSTFKLNDKRKKRK